MDNQKTPLKVSLHAMDERTVKMMILYLQGPCKGAAIVVNEGSADVDIVDADTINGKKIVDERLAKSLRRPVIALSIKDIGLDDVIFVKKPVKTEEMIAALGKAKKALINPAGLANAHLKSAKSAEQVDVKEGGESTEKSELKKYTLDSSQNKSSKHQTAVQMTEASFNTYIGSVPGLDVNDPAQFSMATYNPDEYFQGGILSAVKTGIEKQEMLAFDFGWKPLILLPKTHEIWVDADEKQIRAFAGLKQKEAHHANFSFKPYTADPDALTLAPEKLHSIDAFVWKLACWASKGRYPAALNIDYPVYLKHWPNFTRLLVTPHALRIAALLIREPRTLANVAETLNIKPQFVFVFISAAHAAGLVGLATRQADMLFQPSEIQPSQKQGLLRRIINKLRGTNV
ncbi:MAG: hypothetical protein KGZ88_04355 [Methylomicrobium sp.]|nr:hypothetical protein [Methylomicrobium sp.]